MRVGAPCAVLVDNWQWLRAKILKFCEGNGVVIDLVDVGIDNIAEIENVRPLKKIFGRLPPLALRCRMKGMILKFCLKIENRSGFKRKF